MSDALVERLAGVLGEHHKTRGMAVTSGVTCECGYWTGSEKQPPQRAGSDGLDYHRARIVEQEIAAARDEAWEERAARQVAADAADRFRDVLSECLGYDDENPGDDVLVAELRERFGKAGPEPTRWREFITGARAVVDQINADRAAQTPATSTEEER